MAQPPSSRPVSQRDIAARLGVTHATVSMALRDSPRISETRRQEIKALAQSMGYSPDPMLRQLAAYRSTQSPKPLQSCIAWLNTWDPPKDYFQESEYAAYWRGALNGANRNGFQLEEIAVAHLQLSPSRLIEILHARNIQGVIIPPVFGNYPFEKCDWTGIAVVKLGFSCSTLHSHIVTSDQYEGGALAAKSMIEGGYNRVGFVSTSRFERITRGNFAAGFVHMRDSLTIPKDRLSNLILDDPLRPSAQRRFYQWFRSRKPSAILYSEHPIDIWIMELGLNIPKDIALAGTSIFDSGVDSGLDQFPEEIGSNAVDFVTSMIIERHFGLPEHRRCLLVEPTWKYRKTLPKRKK